MKNRNRRSMMFINTQRPSLVMDAGVFGADSIIFDLEDAIAESEKDSARNSLYYALKNYDFGDAEKLVRINGLNTPHYEEDIYVSVIAGADGIRIPKCESKEDVVEVDRIITEAEIKNNVKPGTTSLMVAIESPKGLINLNEIVNASDRLFGIALGAGDFLSEVGTKKSESGIELLYARSQILMYARAYGLQCFDTSFLDLDDMEGLKRETELIHQLGFDGKSLISPVQIPIVHSVFKPSEKEYKDAKALIESFESHSKSGVGVFTMKGKMVDIALIKGAERVISRYEAGE